MAEQPESGTHEPQASKSPMPFADLAKSVAALNPQRLMEQLTKIFGAYSFPGINVDTRLARNRQNVKALGAANKRGLENAEAVMIRQGEIPRQTLEEISTAFKALSNAGTPEALVTTQGELFRHIFLRAFNDMCELVDRTATSRGKALETINERICEHAEAIKAMPKRLEK